MHSSFNLIEIATLLKSRWRFLLSFTAVAVITAAVVAMMVTPAYESSATLLAGNSALTDKARIFNQQIKDLYGNFGTGDDLDRIQSIAEMDMTLHKVVGSFDLTTYYQLKNDSPAIAKSKAVDLLQKELHFTKTNKDQLIISCQTKNKQLSADLVNAIVSFTEERMQQMSKANYNLVIRKLDSASTQLRKDYAVVENNTIPDFGTASQLKAAEAATILSQLSQYKKISDEYKLAVETQPAFIQIAATASPADKAVWPDKPLIIILAAMAGLCFSSLLVLLRNPGKTL